MLRLSWGCDNLSIKKTKCCSDAGFCLRSRQIRVVDLILNMHLMYPKLVKGRGGWSILDNNVALGIINKNNTMSLMAGWWSMQNYFHVKPNLRINCSWGCDNKRFNYHVSKCSLISCAVFWRLLSLSDVELFIQGSRNKLRYLGHFPDVPLFAG